MHGKTTNIIFVYFLFSIFIARINVFADAENVIGNQPHAAIKTYAKEIIVQGAETNIMEKHEKTWSFEPINTDKRVLVELIMRINHPKTAGWNAYALLKVNGVQLNSLADRTNRRLINKDLHFDHRDWGNDNTWQKYGRWNVPFASDYTSATAGFKVNKDEVHRYVFDISDMISSTETNKISIRPVGSIREKFKNEGFYPDLMIKSIKVVVEKNEKSILSAKKNMGSRPYIIMKDILVPDYNLEVGKSGTIIITGKDFSFPVESYFSIPESKWCSLSPDMEGKWDNLQIVKKADNEYQVMAENKYFKLNRKIVKNKQRIDVFDTLENITSSLVGIKIKHEININNLPKQYAIEEVFLAGDSDSSVNKKENGRNPSVFLSDRNRNTGIGLIANDDVFRIQNCQYYDAGKVGIKTENFALTPGNVYTLEWAIYPASSDYYDFINIVRKDWDVNFTIDGGLGTGLNSVLLEKGDTWANQTLNIMALKYRILASWCNNWLNPDLKGSQVITHHGSGMMEDEQKDLQDFAHKILARAKEVAPSLKRLQYIHVQICEEKNAANKFKDSLVVDRNGKPGVYDSNPVYQILCPTLENSYGKRLFKMVDWLCDNFDIDGLFNDEMNWSGTPITYNTFDGYSVVMDKDTHKVERQVGFVSLLKLPFHKKLVEYILKDKKKILIGNEAPECRTMTQIHFVRFAETFDPSWAYQLHLYTPVTLGDMLMYSKNECANDIRDVLKRGNLYYYYHLSTPYPTITSHMYPFTPIEIHGGWMLGEERILTLYSGSYGWKGKNHLAQTFVYDATGRETSDVSTEAAFTSDGTCFNINNLPDDYMAAIVKIPVEVKAEGQVTLSRITYTPNRLALHAQGNGKLSFIWRERSEGETLEILPNREKIIAHGGVAQFSITVTGELEIEAQKR